MDWVFVFIALTQTGAMAESIHFESRRICTSYAGGRVSQALATDTAKCVNRRTGEIVNLLPHQRNRRWIEDDYPTWERYERD